MLRIIRVSVGLLLLLTMLAGCGSKRVKPGTVSGKVTYKGQPVNDAALLLYSKSDNDQTNPITISVDGEGSFSISDVPPGDYKIVVQGSEGVDNEAAMLRFLPPDKREEMKAKMSNQATPKTIPFPNKYKNLQTTDLQCTITEKDQPLDLELKD